MIGTLLNRLKFVSGGNGLYRARCPIHPQDTLTLREMSNGVVRASCEAGCTQLDIIRHFNLTTEAIFPKNYFFQVKKQFSDKDYAEVFLDIIQQAREAGEVITPKEMKKERELFLKSRGK